MFVQIFATYIVLVTALLCVLSAFEWHETKRGDRVMGILGISWALSFPAFIIAWIWGI